MIPADLARARASLEALAAHAPPTDGRVTLDLDGPIAWLRLDHAPSRNALSAGMMAELARAVEALEAFDGWGVVLASAHPRMFCSGGHLDQVQRALLDPARGRAMAGAMGLVLDRLRDLPLISVAAIDGAAVGGGAELATACDFRIARRDARIHFVQARLGVVAGWGGAARLVALLGRRAALEILARAESLSADEALALGLVDVVVEQRAHEAAVAWLRELGSAPPAALRAVKAQVAGAGDPATQVRVFGEVWGGPAHQAALAALDRRGGR